MFDYDREYAEFKDIMERIIDTPTEEKRIQEELALFELRGWEKYVVLASDIIAKVERRIKPIIFGGSCWDSYAIRKAVNPRYDWSGLLQDKKSHDILFNDALRLDYSVIWTSGDYIIRDLVKLDSVLNECLAIPSLYVKEVITRNEDTKEERMIVSFSPIPDEDVELIAHETRESTPEETARLMKYLIIIIKAKKGI